MKKWIAAFSLGIAFLIGFTVYQNVTTISDDMMISGSFTYRERIMVPPGAKGVVVLQDVSRADAAAIPLAEQLLDLSGKSPPFSYTLSVGDDVLTENGRYAVRIQIRGQDNSLLWTSDTVHSVAPFGDDQNIPPITLVQVSGQTDANSGQAFYETEWKVVSVDGMETPDTAVSSIRFEQDGRVSGRAGCNSFTGSFEQSGGAVSLGPLAMTRRACLPEIGEFETQFSAVFAGTMSFDMRDDMLTLTDEQGRQIVTVYEN